MQRPSLLPGYRFFPSDQELVVHYLDKNEPVSSTFVVKYFACLVETFWFVLET